VALCVKDRAIGHEAETRDVNGAGRVRVVAPPYPTR